MQVLRWNNLRTYWLLCLGLLVSGTSLAQRQFSLKGQIWDEDRKVLDGATVVLRHAADSSLQQANLSTAIGKFNMIAPAGNYLLSISYLGFETWEEQIVLNADLVLDSIIMNGVVETLQGIEVLEEYLPLRMKGDTLEHNAKAYQVEPHETIEDLLSQLPGVEVDENGGIKAQGKNVDKVLIDGKEFFGNNPQMATKNLPADAVDKVQVYDRKSDLAEFSGIDDGERNKTINIKLKEDKKNGLFGHLEAGAGTPLASTTRPPWGDFLYKGNLGLNYFNPKVRFSILGGGNNIGVQNFSLADQISLFGGFQGLASSGHGGAIMLRNNQGQEQGFNERFGGGFNLNWFPSKRVDWNTYYFYTQENPQIQETSLLQSLSPPVLFDQNSFTNNQQNIHKHQLTNKIKYRWKEVNEVKINLLGELSFQETTNENFLKLIQEGDWLQRSLDQSLQQNRFNWAVEGNLRYRRKFAKKGRVLITSLVAKVKTDQERLNNEAWGINYNAEGQVLGLDSLLQLQTRQGVQQSYEGAATWIEPIGQKNHLDIGLRGLWNHYNWEQDASSWEGSTWQPLVSLSDALVHAYDEQQLSVGFQHRNKPFTLTMKALLQRSGIRAVFSETGLFERQYWFPLVQLNARYQPKGKGNLNFRYQTQATMPNLVDLQPAANNESPLFIREGNPNLNPVYEHTFNLTYNWFEQFSFTNLFFFADFTLSQNPVVYQLWQDETLQQIRRPENGPLGYQGTFNIQYGRPIRPLGIKLNTSLFLLTQYRNNQINGEQNPNWLHQQRLSLGLENNKRTWWKVKLKAIVEWNHNVATIGAQGNASFLNYQLESQLKIDIGKRFQVNSKFKYWIFTDPNFEETRLVPMLEAGIHYLALKNKGLKIGFQVFNFFDESLYINRFANAQQIAESQTMLLGRIWQFNLRYKITQVGAKPTPDPLIESLSF